ncbi:MAG: hypothetical protein ACOZQL_39060 [Myxococcota bacterium]
MRIQPKSTPASLPTAAPTPRAPTPAADAPGRAAGWSQAGTANLARDLRATLTHPQGRQLFAELLENQLGDPDQGTGYVWDAQAKTGDLAWALHSSEMADDTMLVRVNGKELSIQSESSGFEGRAVLTGTSREALNAAIAHAVKQLDDVAAKSRGR